MVNLETIDSSSTCAKMSDSSDYITETTTTDSYPNGGVVSSEWITSSSIAYDPSVTPAWTTSAWTTTYPVKGIIASDCTLPFKDVGAGSAVIDKYEEKITKAEENIHRVEKELEKLEENIDYLAEQSRIHEESGKHSDTEIDLLQSNMYTMQQGITDLKSDYLTLHEDVKRIDSMV